LIDAAETRDLPSIRELVDRLDGRPVQTIDRTELPVKELTKIAAGGRTADEMKVIPPMPPKD
jgi:hypothetical protein